MRTKAITNMLGKNQQQGAILIFGLLILTTLAIIGSTSANMGIVNQKIVFNSQQFVEVFHAAETAGTYARGQSAWVNDALAHLEDPNYNSWATYDVPASNEHVTSEATISAQKALLSGFTLNTGASTNYIRLEIEGSATRGSSVTKGITQGWIRVGAG